MISESYLLNHLTVRTRLKNDSFASKLVTLRLREKFGQKKKIRGGL